MASPKNRTPSVPGTPVIPLIFESAIPLPTLFPSRLHLSIPTRPPSSPVCTLPDITPVIGTCFPISTISDDLLSREFLEYILTPEYTHGPYSNLTPGVEARYINVEAELEFANACWKLEFLAKVVKRRDLGKAYSGVILGQWGVLEKAALGLMPGKGEGWGEVRFDGLWEGGELLRVV